MGVLLRCMSPKVCRFLDAGDHTRFSPLRQPAFQKAPRHEVAVCWALAWQRALWGIEVSADVDGPRRVGARPGGQEECINRRLVDARC